MEWNYLTSQLYVLIFNSKHAILKYQNIYQSQEISSKFTRIRAWKDIRLENRSHKRFSIMLENICYKNWKIKQSWKLKLLANRRYNFMIVLKSNMKFHPRQIPPLKGTSAQLCTIKFCHLKFRKYCVSIYVLHFQQIPLHYNWLHNTVSGFET